MTENFDFKINEDTEVYYSCSSVLNGEVLVFGGYNTSNNRKKQVKLNLRLIQRYLISKISKIDGCELKRIGDLNYEFTMGACGTFLYPEERILLCFPYAKLSGCERLVIFK